MMDPQKNQHESPSMELPKPQVAASVEAAVPAEQKHEAQGSQAVEAGLSVSQNNSSAPTNIAAVPMTPVAVPPTGTSIPAAVPQIADDVDLIEKEWVDKAKEIVAATRQDPYQQNKELNRFRADYIQKRYNKVIKLNDE
jgi:hypothetical protein